MTSPSLDYRRLFDLSDRIALVVGAGSGIGEASAHALAAHGARVICADLDSDAAQRVAQAIGPAAEAVQLDMRDATSVAHVLSDLPAPDVLVSTPSINVRKPLLQISDEEFDRVIALNLRGTFFLLRRAGQIMAQRARGSIIVFTSIRSEVVEPGQGVYAATKAGVRQMCRALAAELGPHGVRVNLIAPGIVETPLTAQIRNHPDWYAAYAEKTIFRRWAQPHEMAGAVVFLASDASSYVTGTVLFVDGGWTAHDGRFTPPL
jgi:NAD(P)-dependent dehydrogenase (short-subunit alcohol dehydrogenase family)